MIRLILINVSVKQGSMLVREVVMLEEQERVVMVNMLLVNVVLIISGQVVPVYTVILVPDIMIVEVLGNIVPVVHALLIVLNVVHTVWMTIFHTLVHHLLAVMVYIVMDIVPKAVLVLLQVVALQEADVLREDIRNMPIVIGQ